jgi:2-C-methyl-D-erythritol 4-phosphate cytidylyltransferase
VGELVVVARPGEEGKITALATAPIPVRVVTGGERRQDSARAGAQAAEGKFVLIHDGARPLVSPALIQRIFAATEEHGAAVPILPECDTLRYLDDEFLRPEPLVREGLVRIQTPQGFRRDVLLAAFREAERRGLELPDDAAAVLASGWRVAAVQGEPWNLKITHPEDFTLAERLLI